MKNIFVFITGAATGIGLAASKKYAAMGWQVIATVLPGQDRSALTSHSNIEVVELDITDGEMIDKAYGTVNKIVGSNGLALLINNAGIANIGSGAFEGVSIKDINFVYKVNVFGMMQIVQKFLPLLRRYGYAKIINLASGAVRVPVPFAGAYNSSKFAVVGISKTLRYELAPFGIQVACIEPSTVKSEMTANHKENLEKSWSRMTPESERLYRAPIQPTNEWLSEQITNAIPPENVADKIYKVSCKKKMRIRYGGGSMAEQLTFLEGLIGENLLESMLMKMLRIPKNKFVEQEQ